MNANVKPREVLRMEDLVRYTGLKRTRIKELIAKGEFPKAHKLSERRNIWFAHEIAEWQAQRLAAK